MRRPRFPNGARRELGRRSGAHGGDRIVWRRGTSVRHLVLGQGKSGTTALYAAICDQQPDSVEIFEPKSLAEVDLSAPDLVVKKLIEFLSPDELLLLEHFDRRVFVVRDPRDAVISRLLYTIRDRRFFDDDDKLGVFLAALERKERDPRSISVVELYELIGSLDGSAIIDDVVRLNAKTIDLWRSHGRRFHLLRYEDFIQGELNAVNEYLGCRVDHQVRVPRDLGRVERRKSFGDFKDWFTESDLGFFADKFAVMFETFGYDPDEPINSDPVIDSTFSSAYVRRIVSEKRALAF